MSDSWSGQVAVLADPHLHDIGSGKSYGLEAADCVRSLADSAASTRIFNESGPALVRALDIIAERGVKLVLVAGDLTDDGQLPNWKTAAALLNHYSDQHGMRFFMTPGNHDQWFGNGKPLSKQMVRQDGSAFSLSGNQHDADARHSSVMWQLGQEEMLRHSLGFGFTRHQDDLYWETPFGTADDLSARSGMISRPDMAPVEVPDFSYLVEPVSGLWILSVDANVYLPDASGWRDCGQEGWIAVLRHKKWLLNWMSNIASRARAQGKRLLTMSHFPVVDVLNEVPGGFNKRLMPPARVSEAITETGIGLHFSGHWHINRTGRHLSATDWLVNVAVPSTASFPAAFKLVDLEGDTAQIETVRLGQVPGFDGAFAHYKAEEPSSTLHQTEDYDSFLEQHLIGLAEHRYLDRDWPKGSSERFGAETLASVLARVGLNIPETAKAISARTAIDDYYFLERGGELAGLPPERLALYRSLDCNVPARGDESSRRLILGLARYSQALPDDSFTVNFSNGDVD